MELDQHHSRTVTDSARFALAQWSQRLGVPGFEAMRLLPGLAAAVDQHVAQIRDALGELRADNLAAYADGVADTVTARGWSADEAAVDWSRASWPSLHLLAVCVLAETAG
ncbi:DUF6401 family natural product biosynthesis protein [Actinoplanes utahensis]|uniref:Uncharacterized protein n=1 Tax=Actinoplanes utahensis TaxID=1869 RepID=A0A0A6UAF5_ACTUT|nr:DUF6401 family natural product biosynthesis protein [Actinoplanes utahensis]KHD72043.1 hypothetical protein MB27_42855 [Actinoplanes utahensis]GIF31591.1 hypothetical protein Aut01nite_45770 [Actinoplanes utahensis]